MLSSVNASVVWRLLLNSHSLLSHLKGGEVAVHHLVLSFTTNAL